MHVQYYLKMGLLYFRMANCTFPVMLKVVPQFKRKYSKQQLSFTRQHRHRYLLYSPVLNALAQPG